MEKQEIINSFLSADATRVTEAKAALRALLDARAGRFRADSTKFVAKSLFEGDMTFVPPGIKIGDYGVNAAGAKVIVKQVLGDGMLELLTVDGGTLYKAAGDFTPAGGVAPGVKTDGGKATVGNGLYKQEGSFTPPGGTPPGVKS